MKRYLFILISILFAFSSCVKYEDGKKVYPAKEYIVASERGCWGNGNDGWEAYFFVKEPYLPAFDRSVVYGKERQ